eukprot:g20660.t1
MIDEEADLSWCQSSSWWAPGFVDFAQEAELAAAVLTGVRWKFGEFYAGFGFLAEEGSDAKAGLEGGTGEEAVVADPGEAFGEDMKEPTAQEFASAEFEDAGSFAAGGGVVKAEFAIGGEADDALGPEGAALGVSGQVAEGGFTSSGGLELDVPFDRGTEGTVLLGGEVLVDVGVVGLEGGVDEAAEAGREGLEGDEELVGLLGVDEGVVFRIAGDGGKDDVDVRVVLHGAPPGVKNGGDAKAEVRCF